MPRPSDLYANLGAPGMYQSTPWAPCQLPNVFVCPPEEDDEDVFCLFHSGSASPSTFESFYRKPRYVQRDPSSPTFTDFTAVDNALSYIQQQASAGDSAPVFGRKPGWDHEEHVVMPMRNFSGSSTASYSSGSSGSSSVRTATRPIGAGTTAFPNVSFLVEKDGQHGQNAPSRAASRRSSVFGERPLDHEVFGNLIPAEEVEGGPRPMVKRSQTMSFKSRATVAFKSFGSARVRRTESDVSHHKAQVPRDVRDESFFLHEQGTTPRVKRARRRTLVDLFGPSSSADAPATLPSAELASPSRVAPFPPPPPSPPKAVKLNKRKSLTQLFSVARNSSADVLQVHSTPTDLGSATSPAATQSPSPSLSSPSEGLKLSKRKSMAQLFGIGRNVPSTSMLAGGGAAGFDADESNKDLSEARSATLRALEGPTVKGIPSTRPVFKRSSSSPSPSGAVVVSSQDIAPASTLSDETYVRTSRRKSFLSARPFSFLDLHRHFSSRSAPDTLSRTQSAGPSALSTPPTVQETPESPSEATDSSSSAPTSIDSEPEAEDRVRIIAPRTDGYLPDGVGEKDGPEGVLSSDQLDKADRTADSSQFAEQDDDVDSEAVEPPLELPARLDSLNFDQITFDPESFADVA